MARRRGRLHAVVVAHGDPGGGDTWGRALLATAHLLIAADGGAETVIKWGRYPDVIVGDLDSVGPERRTEAVARGTEIETHPRDKDQTDAEIALMAAQRRGATSIDVVGALGGERLDHALANVLLLELPELRSLDVRLVDGRHIVRLLRGPGRLALDGMAGDVVTLLPLTASARGISTRGLRYPLRQGTLILGRSRGVSNELTGTRATVSLQRGRLLVVHHSRHQTAHFGVDSAHR